MKRQLVRLLTFSVGYIVTIGLCLVFSIIGFYNIPNVLFAILVGCLAARKLSA